MVCPLPASQISGIFRRAEVDANLLAFDPTISQEIDELVDEWTPEPLGTLLTPEEQSDLASVPIGSGANGPRPKLTNASKKVINLFGYHFMGPGKEGLTRQGAWGDAEL